MNKLESIQAIYEKWSGKKSKADNITEAIQELHELEPGSGGVTSWNDLEDIPFGEEIEIVFSGTFSNLQKNVMGMGGVSGTETGVSAEFLEDGKSYIVNYNGIEYSCVCNSEAGAVALGNIERFGGTGNGEPFCVTTIQGELGVFDLNNAESCDIVIKTEMIHPIDPKYLPEGGSGGVSVVIFDIETNEDGDYIVNCDKTVDAVIQSVKNRDSVFYIRVFQGTSYNVGSYSVVLVSEIVEFVANFEENVETVGARFVINDYPFSDNPAIVTINAMQGNNVFEIEVN